MKLISEKKYRLSNGLTSYEYRYDWEKWWAWRPVRLIDGGWVWRRYIEKRTTVIHLPEVRMIVNFYRLEEHNNAIISAS